MAGLIPLFLSGEDEECLSRERLFRDRSNPLDCYEDLELVQHFRFSRRAILKITELIQDHLNSTDRSYAAHPHLQVCVVLQFLASGTFQLICGDGVHVSQPSACRYIRAVALGLQSICSRYISLPSYAEKATIKSQLYELAHFPGVLGLVDGTHVRIQKPSEHEANYVNRHFHHSINVHSICLPNGKFSDILARFPGSVHDSRIWKLSQVRIYVENNIFVGEHILGDSGYMLRKCLLTPYRQPVSIAQENYNLQTKKPEF